MENNGFNYDGHSKAVISYYKINACTQPAGGQIELLKECIFSSTTTTIMTFNTNTALSFASVLIER